MEIKTERMIAYCLGILLFLVGVVCYAAFPQDQPETPIRIMFKSTGGNVLFDHKAHTSEDGYGFECIDCHHAMDEGEKPVSCGECHVADDEDVLKRSDALHTQCKDCHAEDGSGPGDCFECHML